MPTNRRMSRAPNGLRVAGKRLWAQIVQDVADDWELDHRDCQWLEQACRAADRVDELESLLATEGLSVPGSTGQSRLHPAVQEIRMTRQLIAGLLAKIEVAGPEPKTGHLNRRQRNALREVA